MNMDLDLNGMLGYWVCDGDADYQTLVSIAKGPNICVPKVVISTFSSLLGQKPKNNDAFTPALLESLPVPVIHAALDNAGHYT